MLVWFLYLLIYVSITTLYAACYGALQNQISYSVSEGVYFRHHKFRAFEGSWEQFFHERPRDSKYQKIFPVWGNRIGAAVIGVKASWWFGFALGLVLGVVLIGVFWGHHDKLRQEMPWSFCVATSTALVSHVLLSLYILERRFIEPNTTYDLYYKAGIIHNCAYISGALGAVAALCYVIGRAVAFHRG